jgi:hypothetical protein
MEVNEVRIGNIVAIPGPTDLTQSQGVAKQIKAITVFGEFDFSTKFSQEIHSAKHCSGVILTGAWLSRMGFEEIKHSGIYAKGPVRVIQKKGNFYMEHLEHQLKSVHQLQNAYFVRTGEELVIRNLV